MSIPTPTQVYRHPTHWRVWFEVPGGARQRSIAYKFVDVPVR